MFQVWCGRNRKTDGHAQEEMESVYLAFLVPLPIGQFRKSRVEEEGEGSKRRRGSFTPLRRPSNIIRQHRYTDPHQDRINPITYDTAFPVPKQNRLIFLMLFKPASG